MCGCATDRAIEAPKEFTSSYCQKNFTNPDKVEDTDEQLDRLSDLFLHSCFSETVTIGKFIRERRRDKVYSVSTEMLEVFTPEGSQTPYTLESYERSYLSLLISLSYLNLNQENDALIELRRAIREENAVLYNYGADPVLTLLQAAVWDRFDPLTSRPFWKKLSEYKDQDSGTMSFAQQRIKEIDEGSSAKVSWQIFAVGHLPELRWSSNFFNLHGGPYEITPSRAFPKACSAEDEVFISTSSWVDKIAGRYDSGYHPLLYAKSLTRLPVGLGYGAVGVTAGTAVGLGGCVLAAEAKNAGAPLCQASIEAGGYIVGQSANLVEYTLRPDLRHWKNLPIAFLITRGDNISDTSCAGTQLALSRVRLL
jgi:hypothetical protein